MNNGTERERKSARLTAIIIAAGIIAAALTCSIGLLAFKGFNKPQTSNVNIAEPASNNARVRFDGNAYYAEYTYGETYSVNGVNYTLGGTEKAYATYSAGSTQYSGMDYNTALGLGDDYSVTLQSFTYVDGSDGTDETDSVRNAGTYMLNVQAADDTQYIATVDVDRAPIDFSTVDGIPLFVNANSPRYQAHGDIMSVYKHNDGWYPSQKAGEVPVEIRTITNAYYYYDNGKEIPIKIAGEVLPTFVDTNDGNKIKPDGKSATSTLVYSFKIGEEERQVTFSITDRAGTVFSESNEYAATFKFNLTGDDKNNYYFYYGGATEDDEIKDSNKCLSIVQRQEDSFVLSKHWFIVRYANLFVGPDDWNGGKDSTNNPYVPFHTQTPLLHRPRGGRGIIRRNVHGTRHRYLSAC